MPSKFESEGGNTTSSGSGSSQLTWWTRALIKCCDHRNELHLWFAGAGAGVAFISLTACSPWFRRWNPNLTRGDVVRKVLVGSALGGCIGYAPARLVQAGIETASDDSRRVLQDARSTLHKTDVSKFIELYPPRGTVFPSGTNTYTPRQTSILENIHSIYFHFLTPNPSYYSMKACLGHDLYANGVSRRDADIAIVTLAHALGQDIGWASSLQIGMFAFVFITARQRWQHHPRFGALRGAPMLPIALAAAGDVLSMVALSCWLVTCPNSYVDLMENKAVVASVVRDKFGKQLE